MKKRITVRLRLSIDDVMALIDYHDLMAEKVKPQFIQRHKKRVRHLCNVLDKNWTK